MNTLKKAYSSILLDIGGTYIKSAVIENGSAHPQNLQRFRTPNFIPARNEYRVIPTQDLLNTIDQAISLQKSYKPEAHQIFICGQMGGYVLESNCGFEIISWQDSRSLIPGNEKICSDLDQWISNSSSFRETGSEIRPGLPFYSLAIGNFKHTNLLPKQPFRSIVSFVTSYLTDFKTEEMHVTDAAASGLFSLKENTWSKQLTSMTGEFLSFPTVQTDLKKIGFSKRFQLDVISGVGDQQASLLGAGLQLGNVVVNIGTGGQIAGLHKESDGLGKYQIRPYFFGQRIRTITHLPSGRALKAFIEYCYGEPQTDEQFLAFEQAGIKSIDAPDIDLVNYEKSLSLITEAGYKENIELISSMFFKSLIGQYIRSLKDLDLPGDLVFAGGVGQKVGLISNELSKLSDKKFRISDMEETTIEGLGILANKSH